MSLIALESASRRGPAALLQTLVAHFGMRAQNHGSPPMLFTAPLSDRSPRDHGDGAVAQCSCEACDRAAKLAGQIQRGLRDVQAQEIEVGETAAAYLAYGLLRRGWDQ